MPPKKGGGRKVKKTASGYRMPDHLPPGTILTDLNKKQWVLGESVGTGGFGEIYLAMKDGKGEQKVVKIEPHENGPLFVEMHFYISAGKPEHLQEWRKVKKVKNIPHLPMLSGHGSYQHKVDDTYRFLVIDRLGKDLDKFFKNGTHPLSMSTVANVTVQVVTALEYIHFRGYTHNDVKAANLLLGLGEMSNNIYLVDFGLCVKYMKGGVEGTHKEYRADPRKAHDGTIEYLSRDAHAGCTSRRSDMEVLGFNIIHWLTGSLPWLPLTNNPGKVQAAKEQFMNDLDKNTASLPKQVQEFMKYVARLDFEEDPDYDKLRGFFMAEASKCGDNLGLNEAAVIENKNVVTAKGSVIAVDDDCAVSEKENVTSPVKKAKKAARKKKAVVETESEEEIDPSPIPTKRVKKAPVSKPKKLKTSSDHDSIKDKDPASTPKNTILTVPKYQEAACQTSPAFVAAARAARKGLKALAQSEYNVRVDSPGKTRGSSKETPVKGSKLTPRNKVERNTPTRKGKSGNSTPCKDNSANSLKSSTSNPTPAMLAIMQKKQQVRCLDTLFYFRHVHYA